MAALAERNGIYRGVARTPLLTIRVDAETKKRWEADAKRAGVSLSAFVRGRVDGPANVSSSPKTPFKPVPSGTAKPAPARGRARSQPAAKAVGTWGRPRTGLCHHRVPATAYCSRCDG